jgi:site-specific DNA recombinase
MIKNPTQPNQKKKAIAYVRVSSSRQVDNESPDTQRAKINQFAEMNNIEIVKWFDDMAQSAKNADRKELQNLIKFALAYRDQIDHVIVYKMSRASRDATTYYRDILGKLYPRGITIRSATETFDDSPGGRFMELIHVGMAQFDNGVKSEYTRDNMQSLEKQGYYQHAPILGYENCKVKNDEGKDRPSLKPNDIAPKVKEVLERFSYGDMNQAEVTRFAHEIGLRSRNNKVLGKDAINRLLKSPTYAGFIRTNLTSQDMNKGRHEALISEETYRRNQLILSGKHSRKDELHLKKNHLYVLKGTLRCVGCENILYASAPRTGNGGHSPRYHCGKCKLKSIPARVVHEDFEGLLERIKPSEGTLRLYKEVLIREANSQLGRINVQIGSLRQELDDISVLRVEAIEKFTKGDLTKAEKNEFVDSLEIRKIEATDKLKDMEEVQSLRESEIEYAITFMERVDRLWSDADFDLQQRFQKMIFPRGVVYDYENRRFGTSEISALYRLGGIKNEPEMAQKSYMVAGTGLEPATSWL